MAKKVDEIQEDNDVHNLTLKKRAMIEALKKVLGNVKKACDLVGIARQTHYDWCRDDPEYKSQYEDLDNLVLDFVEDRLHDRIREGSDACIIYFLKTKGKKRGYTEELTIRQGTSTLKPEIPQDIE